jgi:hypothetical protein
MLVRGATRLCVSAAAAAAAAAAFAVLSARPLAASPRRETLPPPTKEDDEAQARDTNDVDEAQDWKEGRKGSRSARVRW